MYQSYDDKFHQIRTLKDRSNKIWFDTEFIEDGKTIELLSIGMVKENGETYYAEPEETDRSRACEWVQKNVIPFLHGPVKPKKTIAKEILYFADKDPEFWGYFADYDWVVLAQLYGRMIDLPFRWPHYCRDIKQIMDEFGIRKSELPKLEGNQHNALDDAIWTMKSYHWLMAYKDNFYGPHYTVDFSN